MMTQPAYTETAAVMFKFLAVGDTRQVKLSEQTTLSLTRVSDEMFRWHYIRPADMPQVGNGIRRKVFRGSAAECARWSFWLVN